MHSASAPTLDGLLPRASCTALWAEVGSKSLVRASDSQVKGAPRLFLIRRHQRRGSVQMQCERAWHAVPSSMSFNHFWPVFKSGCGKQLFGRLRGFVVVHGPRAFWAPGAGSSFPEQVCFGCVRYHWPRRQRGYMHTVHGSLAGSLLSAVRPSRSRGLPARPCWPLPPPSRFPP